MPRNVGIQFARGKYIAFLDSDDLFTRTALEEMTTLAEKYQADIVHNDEFYFFSDEKLKDATTEELLNAKNLRTIHCNPASSRLSKTTDEPNNLAERVKLWVNSDYHWATCALFCRRDFLIINRISFPKMTIGEDQILNFACLCLAKKLLRIPNLTYIVRQRTDSISHHNIDLEKYFHKWLGSLNIGFNEFNKVMNQVPFFSEHPDYRYAVLNYFFELTLRDAWQLRAAYEQIHAFQLNALVKKEFHPDDAAFSSYLFDMVNIYRLQIMQLQVELSKFQKQ
ncbi:MAG: glycosyltransferase [Selenomonadaceae bacterium]|nr:glycosyltransferase [Selenomonadaceae bacterium]